MEHTVKTYEGMFLLDAGNPDFKAASEPVHNVLNRYKAEILSIKPWDERRLAYQIRGHKRGLYVLVYFKTDPTNVVEIQRDCQLDEKILRTLILHKDRLSDEEINADTPATGGSRRPPATEPPKPAESAKPTDTESPTKPEQNAQAELKEADTEGGKETAEPTEPDKDTPEEDTSDESQPA